MIFVPMLHYLQNKNSFSGNEDGMRYLITPGKRSVPDPDGGEEAKKEEAILTVARAVDAGQDRSGPAAAGDLPDDRGGPHRSRPISERCLQRRTGTLERPPVHPGL